MKNKESWEDPIVAEVRRVRDSLSKKFDYDVEAICDDLMKRQGETVTTAQLKSAKYASPPRKRTKR